jgi:hypothetical protein
MQTELERPEGAFPFTKYRYRQNPVLKSIADEYELDDDAFDAFLTLAFAKLNTSPGNLGEVFRAELESAHAL